MKQKTHTWIALRAMGLIEKDRKTKKLAELLKPHARLSSIGCWIPDMTSFKKGNGQTNNHTFKIEPFSPENYKRFILPKKNLLKKIDRNIGLYRYIDADKNLSSDWWGKAYKADQPNGRHLPDCMSSIFDTILDLMLLGDKDVDLIVPGTINFSKYLDPKVAIRKEQISTFFFMISHFIADCFMPCHCDARPLASFSKGKIHKKWEEHWERIVGSYFSKKSLYKTTDNSSDILEKAKEVDDKVGISFPEEIKYDDNDDIWEQAIIWCRASFAFSSILFPKNVFPFDGKQTPTYNGYLKQNFDIKTLDSIILQSSVYTVASIWKKIWRKFKA